MNITWTTEKRKISDLIPAEYNPRELTEEQVKNLSASLKKFSLADPIVINSNNRIIGGHQRINILKQEGNVEVDVRIPGGSGSTLIACEKTNRICYGMEIDEHYCDVIIKRWEDYTGNKAEKLNVDMASV